MRIVCLSDTHRLEQDIKVPAGDVLIHAGDFSSLGAEREVEKFAKWLRRQPHPKKVIVAGNHDRYFEEFPDLARLYFEPEAIYLKDSGCEIEGFRFWGSPWQPWFMDWAFNLPRRGQALREKWNLIPFDTDILITHCPPWGVMDAVGPRMTPWGQEAEGSGPLGCEELAIRLATVRPMLHVFGHIHDGYGILQQGPTTYVNACICNEDYRPNNTAIVLDLVPGRAVGVLEGPSVRLPKRQRRARRSPKIPSDL